MLMIRLCAVTVRRRVQAAAELIPAQNTVHIQYRIATVMNMKSWILRPIRVTAILEHRTTPGTVKSVSCLLSRWFSYP